MSSGQSSTPTLSLPKLQMRITSSVKPSCCLTDMRKHPRPLLITSPSAPVVYDDIFARTGSEDIKAQVDYARGQMFTALGQVEQATTAYVDAVFNFPHAYFSYLGLIELVNAGYPVDELQRGLVDYYAGQYSIAPIALDRYLSGSPSDPSTALYHPGLIMRDQDEYAEALTLWDAVIQGGENSSFWDSAWEQKAYTQMG